MRREPVTLSLHERIAYYRDQAALFEGMAAAEADRRIVARDLLMDLSRQFNSVADSLQDQTREAEALPREGGLWTGYR